MPIEVGGEQSYACPRQTLRERAGDWNRLLMFYSLYLKGFLPDQGAVIDQSNVLMEAFRLIDEANAEADKELAEIEARKRGRGKGRVRR